MKMPKRVMAGLFGSAGSKMAAVRTAVPSAHRLAVIRPMTKTPPPQAASSSQAACDAGTNPVRSGPPCRFPATIEPVMATPRTCPI